MRERSRVVKNAMNAQTMGFMILDPLGQAKRSRRSLMWFAQAIKNINGYRLSGRTGVVEDVMPKPVALEDPTEVVVSVSVQRVTFDFSIGTKHPQVLASKLDFSMSAA